jgi:hypothetical protein
MNNLDVFQGANNAVAAKSIGITGGMVMTVLLVVFAGVVIYMVLGKALPSLTPTLVPQSTSVYWKSKRVWAPSGVTQNLTAYPTEFGAIQDTAYSFNMDLILKETRTNDTAGLHRHIFHRGSDDYDATPPPAALPKRMNPGVFLDPLTNDLLIFVDTLGGTTGYRESLRIPDLPLGTPFRLGLVLNNRTLDVYLNCGLEETRLLQGTPRTVENRLFGLAGPSPAPAQLQNVYCWESSLSATEMRAICGGAPSFALTPTCGVQPPSASQIANGEAASSAPTTTGMAIQALGANATSFLDVVTNTKVNR